MSFGRKEEKQKEAKVIIEKPQSETEKFKAIFSLSKSLDKKFDTTNSLICLGKKNVLPIPVIPTNLPSFDFGALD